MFKRILSKLVTQRSSQQLVLNSPTSCFPASCQYQTLSSSGLQRASVKQVKQALELVNKKKSSTTNCKSNGRNNKHRSHNNNGVQHHSNKRQSNKRKTHDPMNLESELLATLSRMPTLKFHPVHGQNALLSNNSFAARRTQSFCQAIVFSDRTILPNERVYVKVTEITKGWSGTIRFGFTSLDPDSLRYDMPKHACPDMTSAGNTWARALPDEIVKENTVIHFSYNPAGYINYGINNHECGLFYTNVKMESPLWFIVDIYGLTSAVELIDPRTHPSTWLPELDYSRSARSEFYGNQQENNDDHNNHHLAARVIRVLRPFNGNKHNSSGNGFDDHTTTTATETVDAYFDDDDDDATNEDRQHMPHISHDNIGQARARARSRLAAAGRRMRTNETVLPNLDSIVLHPSRQNIYTSMPAVNVCINRLGQEQNSNVYGTRSNDGYCRIAGDSMIGDGGAQRRGAIVNEIILSPLNHPTNGLIEQQEFDHEASSSSFIRDSVTVTNRDAIDCQRQMSRLTLNDCDYVDCRQPSTSLNESSSSSKKAPVAAARKVRHQQQASGNVRAKRHSNDVASNNQGSVIGSRANKTKGSTSISHNNNNNNNSVNSKSHKTTNKSILTSDKNSNNQSNAATTKDCPICFERPINCVLYQCGHMCTCYECGVKQWRTQSRTCPICRTIIKDVIKTYMS